MNKPIRTTIVFGLLSGVLIYPLATWLTPVLGWFQAFKLTVWADLAIYAVLLARWSRTPLSSIVFPLALLGGVAVWPYNGAGFFLLALGMLSWIRSGICYRGVPLRALTSEFITLVGGAGLVALWMPRSAFGWMLGIWLFALMQTLYFFIMPGSECRKKDGTMEDPFERARHELEKVISDPF